MSHSQNRKRNVQHMKSQNQISDSVSLIKLTVCLLVPVIITILGRFLPHTPNITPILALSLFLGANFPSRIAFITIFIMMLFSDIAIGFYTQFPTIGNWTFFTYSGFIAIAYLGSILLNRVTTLRLVIITPLMSLCFWIWTNLGVWLVGTLYTKSLSGLLACYIAAIPFLHNAIFGDVCWILFLFVCNSKIKAISKKKHVNSKLFLLNK